MLQFYLAKIIKRIEFQGNSTRYFCIMLQFYLAKIIKRSEFYYADFYYQRYMLNLIASMPSFGEKVRLSSLIKTWLLSNINDIASMPTTDDRYIRH